MASTAIDPPTAAPNGNHQPLSKPTGAESQAPLPPPKHIPTLTAVMLEPPKRYQDVLAYEDKWIGWDGPVWCKRYGRFENVDDAAKDDGFDSSGQAHHQDLGPDHKHASGCTCHAFPPQHRSYVADIQRRVEPMVASLVKLEHQVANLVHHLGIGVHNLTHDKIVASNEPTHVNHNEGSERFAMHDDGLNHFANRREPQNHQKEEMLVKLEAEIHALQHQVHELMKNDLGFVRNT